MTQVVAPPESSTASETVLPHPPPVPSRGNRARMLVAALVGSWLAAILCNGVLELFRSGGNVELLFTYSLDEARLIFLMSSALVWVVLVGVAALLGRLWLTFGVVTAMAAALGFASAQKTTLRQEPIYPSDFAFAGQTGFLGQMVGTSTLLSVIAILVLILLISVLLGRIVGRVYPPIRRRSEPRRWRALVAARIAALLCVALTAAYVGQFNSPGNAVRETYERAGVKWAFWFQRVNYERNGFLAGFLYNLPGPAMTEPEGYGPDAMAEVARKYAAVADRMNAGRSSAALSDVNIVVVLSEAFTDPTTIAGPTYAEDPIPFTRSLMERTRSGTMLPQLFGGGTANMEFETLTGMSLSQFLPQMNTPYQQLVTETPTFPSVVGYLRRLGHRPIGVHPYMTAMYKRYAVYPTLGFDSFVDEDQMQQTERVGEDAFISDGSAFDEVVHQLETTDDPALVNLVTMQNHYPMADKYDDPVPVEGVSGELADQLGGYLRGLQLTDAALEEFVGALRRSDEKTAVVLYGDHAPAFWSGDVYEENGETAFRRTPYLMWTNFKTLPAAENALTSPIYFLPTLLDDLGAPLPPYYALLLQLQQEIGAMEQGEYYLPDGTLVEEDDLGERAQELLHDYRLLQYDLAVGERYAQEEMFYPED